MLRAKDVVRAIPLSILARGLQLIVHRLVGGNRDLALAWRRVEAVAAQQGELQAVVAGALASA